MGTCHVIYWYFQLSTPLLCSVAFKGLGAEGAKLKWNSDMADPNIKHDKVETLDAKGQRSGQWDPLLQRWWWWAGVLFHDPCRSLPMGQCRASQPTVVSEVIIIRLLLLYYYDYYYYD